MSAEDYSPTPLPVRFVSAVPILFDDSPAVDSFGRLRVSTSTTLFDSQQEYGLDTLRLWDAIANGTAHTASSNGSAVSGGNSVGPRNVDTRMVPITVSGTDGHYSVLQSRQYTRYIPGKSHLVFITGVFSTESDGAAYITRRTSTSGAVVDTDVAQADWNIDNFDGTGPSRIIIDFTKTQIMFMTAQWLGVGRVVVGFDVNGILWPAHEFLNANALSVPYTQSFNLPVRLEARTASGATTYAVGYFDANNGILLKNVCAAGGTMYFVCCSVQSEGGEKPRGYPNSAPSGIVTKSVTTRIPIMSIRPKTTYNGVTNRAHIDDIDFLTRNTSGDSFIEIVMGGVLTGAAWTSAGANSVAEYDTTATAITGGVTIQAQFSISGSGTTANQLAGGADIRSPLTLSQIDALTANQINLTICATSFSGTATTTAIINWHEQVV